MESIYIIGDNHTVNAFRIAGVEGISAGAETAESALDEILAKGDASVIIITRECAAYLDQRIKSINLESADITVIKIPGIDDEGGFGASLMSFITEALGVAL